MFAAMPTGPKGQKRPADVIGNAVRVARIATAEEPESVVTDSAAQELGKKGGRTRSERLSPERRSEIARNAAAARWRKEWGFT
jgi:hypothetical protein